MEDKSDDLDHEGYRFFDNMRSGIILWKLSVLQDAKVMESYVVRLVLEYSVGLSCYV